MIDLHSHVLPGLDDGAADLEQAVAMCEAAAADGIRVLAATPHVRDDYPTTADEMEAALAEVRAAAGDVVELAGGGELDLGELDRPKEELQRFALGGSSWLLLETPYFAWPLDVADKVFRLRLGGFSVVLAHPERSPDIQSRPELLEPLVASGTLVQLTASSVDGRLGSRTRNCALDLLDRGFAHLIASDAHAPDVRAIGMSGAVEALDDERFSRWLTVDVPQSILDGTPTPPRPEQRPRRRGWFRR